MSNIIENRYFFIIKKEKILFIAIDHNNVSLMSKEIFIQNYTTNNIFDLLDNFLKKNIIDLEKNLRNFVKKIFIIFEYDKFLVVKSSTKLNFKKVNFDYNQIKDSLTNIRNQFIKCSPEYEIIHMIVNEYQIDGIAKKNLPEHNEFENLIIQTDFICLEDQIVKKLKQIFLKYEISISKILCYDYLKNLNKHNNQGIVESANDSINQLNNNEFFMVKKELRKQGFFEKIFNFFG